MTGSSSGPEHTATSCWDRLTEAPVSHRNSKLFQLSFPSSTWKFSPSICNGNHFHSYTIPLTSTCTRIPGWGIRMSTIILPSSFNTWGMDLVSENLNDYLHFRKRRTGWWVTRPTQGQFSQCSHTLWLVSRIWGLTIRLGAGDGWIGHVFSWIPSFHLLKFESAHPPQVCTQHRGTWASSRGLPPCPRWSLTAPACCSFSSTWGQTETSGILQRIHIWKG